MKVFLAGAGGAVGKAIIPMLINAGHQVTALTRSEKKSSIIKSLGAIPIIADAMNEKSVVEAICKIKPDAIIHQMTAINPGRVNLKKLDKEFELTNKLRTVGTDYLLKAAREAGVKKFIIQSFAGWNYERTGGKIKTENDPLDPNPPRMQQEMMAAIQYLEKAVFDAPNINATVLRYGAFYGPGTSLSLNGTIVEDIRKRMFPIVGGGTGIWSFAHIEDVASATVAALHSNKTGVFNIVDDDPAPLYEWLPYLAEVVGAKPPMRLPVFIARPIIGEVGISFMTQIRGVSNAKAKKELNWAPKWKSWREGFKFGL